MFVIFPLSKLDTCKYFSAIKTYRVHSSHIYLYISRYALWHLIDVDTRGRLVARLEDASAFLRRARDTILDESGACSM